MAVPRTDKIYGHLKADGTYVWFRYDIDDNGVRQFLFQTGTSAPDQATVIALPEFTNPDYPASVTATGQVIDASLISGTFVAVVAVPATAGSAGTAGTVSYDTDYWYVCVASNTWRRVALAEW